MPTLYAEIRAFVDCNALAGNPHAGVPMENAGSAGVYEELMSRQFTFTRGGGGVEYCG
jgi:hypothetical protein